MLEQIRQRVYSANMALKESGLVIFTWGNASEIDRQMGLVVIKPSGVDYEELSPGNMVIVDMEGNVVEGSLRPSSDTATHIELYKAFADIGGVVHTHSRYATSWAQAGKDIPALGTTHADNFFGNIPCTREMTRQEINSSYERETGRVIAERMQGIDPLEMRAVLVREHGPFTWGKTAAEAVKVAITLEEVAQIALNTSLLAAADCREMSEALKEKHFRRKHGANAYYGQN